MTHEELLEKIKKLLALADSSNPHEAAAALSRAQKLMKKYNIQKDSINSQSHIGMIELQPQKGLKNSAITKNICFIISKAFGVECVFYSNKSSIDKILLFGPRNILDSCEYIFIILSRAVYTAVKQNDIGLKLEAIDELSKIGFIKLRAVLFKDGVDYSQFKMLYDLVQTALKNTLPIAKSADIKATEEIKKLNKLVDTLFQNAPNCKYYISHYVSQSKKGFVSGFLSAIYKNVNEFVIYNDLQLEIKSFMHSYFDGKNLKTSKSRRSAINTNTAINAFERGNDLGSKITINSAIHNNSKQRKLLT